MTALLMVILSFGGENIASDLSGEPRFDQSFLDWIKDKEYPVLDMRDSFREEFTQFDLDPKSYLSRYYIGHHNPAGNFFSAMAIKDRVSDWLDPKPLPYQ